MNLDANGLPVQSDGDANDQLQRVGMCLTAYELSRTQPGRFSLDELVFFNALYDVEPENLQVEPGVYVRYVGGSPDNVSCDQLIGALGAHVSRGHTKQVFQMLKTCLQRFGFAQNKKDGLNDLATTKTPDFMLVRAAPLFLRAHCLLYPLTCIVDLLLVFAALAAVGPVWKDGGGFKRRDPNDVDDNNTILTFAVCRARMPTPLSILALKIYSKLRPWNYGCEERVVVSDDTGPIGSVIKTYKPVYGALRWYHRAEGGGNPEVATLWKPIIDRYFGGST